MSKSAEDILKEMESVEELSSSIDAAVEESEAAVKVALKPAPKKTAEVAPAPAAKRASRPVAGDLDLNALLTPAYKSDLEGEGAPVPVLSKEAIAAATGGVVPPIEGAKAAPAQAAPVVESAPVQSAPQPIEPSGDRAGVSVLPATGKILEQLSASLDLISTGAYAQMQRAGLQEQAEQLGIMSMVLANLKKVQSQVDGLLGR